MSPDPMAWGMRRVSLSIDLNILANHFSELRVFVSDKRRISLNKFLFSRMPQVT